MRGCRCGYCAPARWVSRWQAVHPEEGTVHMTYRMSLPQDPFSHWAAEGPANLTPRCLPDSFVPERRDIEQAKQASVSRDHRGMALFGREF